MPMLTHSLYLRKENGDHKIEIRIFQPERNEEAWQCRYEIDWPEGTQVMTPNGVSALQALTLALKMIGTDIYTSAYHREGSLWAFEKEDGYGFPVPNNIRDLLVGIDKMAF